MSQLLTGDIWKQSSKLLDKKDKIVAAIAYVTQSTLPLKEGDILICDASKRAIELSETKASILRSYFKKKVKIYSVPQLHAKLLYSNNITIIGSANLSINSAEHLIEAAFVSFDVAVINQAEAFCFPFISDRYEVTEENLIELEAIVPKRKLQIPKGIPKERNRKFDTNYWIINTKPDNSDKYDYEIEENKERLAKKHQVQMEDICAITWRGKSKFRSNAKLGNTAVEISSSGYRTKVCIPMSIVKIDMKSDCTIFYFKPSNNYIELSWTAFEKRIKSLTLNRQIAKSRTRMLTSHDYHQILKALS